MMDSNAKIYIAGHRGLVGSAILRNLQAKDYTNFVLRTHTELELERQAERGRFDRVVDDSFIATAVPMPEVAGARAHDVLRESRGAFECAPGSKRSRLGLECALFRVAQTSWNLPWLARLLHCRQGCC